MDSLYFSRKMSRAESKTIWRIHNAAENIQRTFRGYRTRRRVGRIWIRVKNFWSEILQDVISNKSPNLTPFEGTAMAKTMEREAEFDLSNQRRRAQSNKTKMDNLINTAQLDRTSETMWSKFPCVHPGRLLASEPILFSSPKTLHLLWSKYKQDLPEFTEQIRRNDSKGGGITRQPSTSPYDSLALKKHRRSSKSKQKRVHSHSIPKRRIHPAQTTKIKNKTLPSIGKKVLQLAAKKHDSSTRKRASKKQDSQLKVLHNSEQARPRERIRNALDPNLRRDEGLEIGYLKLEQTRINKVLEMKGRHANRANKLRKKLRHILSVTQKLAAS